MPLTADKVFRLNVSEDKLTATLTLHQDDPPDQIAEKELCAQLNQLGVVDSAFHAEGIAQFVSQLNEKKVPQPAVVAQGIVPEDDQNGKAIKLYELAAQEESENKNAEASHYDRSDIITVEDGQPLLELIPPVSGKDGRDIYGKEVARKLGREIQVRLGMNVRQEDDKIYAKTAGSVKFASNKVWVEPKLEIRGDVDFAVGNIDFTGDVVVNRNILDLFKVHSRTNIIVKGLIEAAEVHADNDLTSNGGITGKEKGIVTAGNDVISKYISNATVNAGNDVKAQTEIINSEVACGGVIYVEKGPLVGGHAVARSGVNVKILGSDANVATLVDVGVDEEARRKCMLYAPEIDKRRQQAQKIRQVVEPLLANQKQLNNEQKEKATELLYQTYEIDEAVDGMIDELRRLTADIEDPDKPIEVDVQTMLYAGVVLRFPRVEARVTESVKGPLKVSAKRSGGNLTLFVEDLTSGATQPLKSGDTRDPFWPTLDRLLAPPEEDEE